MTKSMHLISLCSLAAIFCSPGMAAAQSKEPEIFLCIDSLNRGQPSRLVYTYLNGAKTPCMERLELLAFCKRESGKNDPAALAMQQRLKTIDSCKAAFENGRKCVGWDLASHDLMGMKLPGADFSDADFTSADARNADLHGAKFTNANLTNAFFRNANLRDADFTDANLNGAYFQGADLRGAKGLTMDDVRMARTFDKALLDSTFRAEIEYSCSDKLKPASWYWHGNAWADDKTPIGKLRMAEAAKSLLSEQH